MRRVNDFIKLVSSGIKRNKYLALNMCVGIPGGAVVKNPVANAGDTGDAGSIPGSGRSPGIENGNPLQYSCLGNPMDRGTWQATVHGVTESDMTEHMHAHICTHTLQLHLKIPNISHE